MNRFLFELIKGLMIGAGAILPGISGASLAVVFGVYEEFTELLSHPFQQITPFLKKHIFLCLGIGIGFIGFTLLLDTFFGTHTVILVVLFSGFIAGTLPGIYTQAKKNGIGIPEILAFCIASTIFFIIAYSADKGSLSLSTLSASPSRQVTLLTPVTWILTGAIIGAGSLLPGISASFILIYLGIYGPLLDALGSRAIGSGALLGVGAILSLVVLSRLVAWLYKKAHGIVSFAVLGCTLGSLVLVFPGFSAGINTLQLLLLTGMGFASSFFLDRMG